MAIDLARRQTVMARSRRLGHCVCNPKNPCPCPTFIEHNVCPCAGERRPVKQGAVALTRHVRKAGCASKIGQADLHKVLSGLPAVTDPNVLVGTAAGDDAGVYRLDDGRALVQTVDVFTPCVDDAYLFGQIAAANSVSDVYAMGGKPLTALSIIGFPIDELDGRIMEDILRGGADKLEEAGCALIGGHSINDEEIKCGFAVTGLVDAAKVVQRDRARPGDVLVLTKPLGTGMVCFAAQLGRADQAAMDDVGAAMATLNKDAAELMAEHDAHACTDVTGFGLAGHLVEMARGSAGHLVEMVRGSGVTAEIDLAALPVFGAAGACLDAGILSGAIERNQAYAMSWIRIADGVDPRHVPVLYDPQTSGGLLVALPEASGRAYVEALHARGHAAATIVGRIVEDGGRDGGAVVVDGELGNFIGPRRTMDMTDPKGAAAETGAAEASCCDAPPGVDDGTAAEALGVFNQFMKAANQPGLIDARAKKLMAIALSVVQRCEPCLKIHLRAALAMGISKAEIDEAANLAIAFGGCTAMMFYKDVCQELNTSDN